MNPRSLLVGVGTLISRVALAAAAMLMPWGVAHADPVCIVSSAAPLAFGAYSPLGFSDALAQTQIGVRCTGHGVRLMRVQIGAGLSGSAGRRSMMRTGAELRYGLYLDSARCVPWGDGTDGTFAMPWLAVPGTSVALPVYGRIPARQNVPVGLYADAVVVRFDW